MGRLLEGAGTCAACSRPSGGHGVLAAEAEGREDPTREVQYLFVQCWPAGPRYLCEEFEGLAVCAESFHIAPSSSV